MSRSATLLLSLFFVVRVTAMAQGPSAAAQSSSSSPAANAPLVRTFTRMVTIEVVAKDSKGRHIEGLKPEDFVIEEQISQKSRQWNPQKMATFREVHMTGLEPPAVLPAQTLPGTYTNILTAQKDPVPATILLVDGLNTPTEHQAQVHVQMLRMLRQLPPNVPVAVFLFGDRLTMLQTFTSDPKLLQDALGKAITAAGGASPNLFHLDNPGTAANMIASTGDSHVAALAAALEAFEEKVYAANLNRRVDRTIQALTSLGHHLAGYPGRKNLLWLSTSFPITLGIASATKGLTSASPAGFVGEDRADSGAWAELRNFQTQLRDMNAVLSDAQVAVYPVDLGGVQTPQVYNASSQPAPFSSPYQSGTRAFEDTLLRDDVMKDASLNTMENIAEGTGGRVCTGDNDLGSCVHKAVEDGRVFYEITYYSNSPDWNGEFRRIAVKSKRRDVHLKYRQGYFATAQGNPDTRVQSAQMQSSCDANLDATAVPFTATALPAGNDGQLRFSLMIDARAISLPETADGAHQLNVAIGVCTFDRKDFPQKIMNYPVSQRLDARQYASLTGTGKLSDTVIIPAPAPPAVRFLVKDVSSGRLGSIYVKTADLPTTRASTH